MKQDDYIASGTIKLYLSFFFFNFKCIIFQSVEITHGKLAAYIWSVKIMQI